MPGDLKNNQIKEKVLAARTCKERHVYVKTPYRGMHASSIPISF